MRVCEQNKNACRAQAASNNANADSFSPALDGNVPAGTLQEVDLRNNALSATVAAESLQLQKVHCSSKILTVDPSREPLGRPRCSFLSVVAAFMVVQNGSGKDLQGAQDSARRAAQLRFETTLFSD